MNKFGIYIQKLMTTILDMEQEEFVKNLAFDELKRLNVNIEEFLRKHHEDDSASGLDYIDAYDLANSTDFQILPNETGNEDDESTSGVLKIFNAGSTVLSKNFISRSSNAHHNNISMDNFVAGYINDTTAIDEISFKFTSGTVDGGEMYMYGVKNA